MGVITIPFLDQLCDGTHGSVNKYGEGKQHTEFLFNGQWLDESNEEEPFSSLSCPAVAIVLAWA